MLRVQPNRARGLAAAAGVLALLLVGSALAIRASSHGGLWNSFLLYVARTRDIYYEAANYHNPEFARDAAVFAAKGLFLAAGISGTAMLALCAATRWPRVLPLLALFAVAEAFYFARDSRVSFNFSILNRLEKAQFFASHPGEHRYLQLGFSNDAMLYRIRDLAGYDPCALRRYAEFIAWTQGENPDQADAYISFKHYHPLFQMLRCQYFVQPLDAKGGYADVQFADKFRFGQLPPAMLRLQLLDKYSVVHGDTPQATRDALFKAMARPGFNPRQEVVLESEPNPKPQKGTAPGQVRVIDGSSDHLTVIARLPRPMLLLVTDAYSRGWRAWSMAEVGQPEYSVLPANYVLRAVALPAGDHMIRFEYAPASFQIGKWISILSLLLYTGLVVMVWRVSSGRITGTSNNFTPDDSPQDNSLQAAQ